MVLFNIHIKISGQFFLPIIFLFDRFRILISLIDLHTYFSNCSPFLREHILYKCPSMIFYHLLVYRLSSIIISYKKYKVFLLHISLLSYFLSRSPCTLQQPQSLVSSNYSHVCLHLKGYSVVLITLIQSTYKCCRNQRGDLLSSKTVGSQRQRYCSIPGQKISLALVLKGEHIVRISRAY